MNFPFQFPYPVETAYSRNVAYFSMEFGIDQPLKTYAGGLGFLAGSHMRSAWELKQPVTGIGILWKYGYYDQVHKQDQTMDVLFEEKKYGFLKETGLRFKITVSKADVWVTAYYLDPEVFHTAPVFFLSTDIPENDYLARTISHKLYDANPETKIAAAILLGNGGARLLELIGWKPDVYHLNESHALPLVFHLYKKYRNAAEVRKHLVFTNHTPEDSGNQKTNLSLLEKMGFFSDLSLEAVKEITATTTDQLDHTLTALRLSGIANAVSKLHLETMKKMWGTFEGICPMISITNAQDFNYWNDNALYRALQRKQESEIQKIKQRRKKELFEIVADQSGEIYDEKICTIVFAKRFAGYKRPDIFFHDMDRFKKFVQNTKYPVQIIWAGKPYPMDYTGIGIFDKIVDVCKTYDNCSILIGYELKLSKLLKRGSDIWLNVPRLTHEASGTSGMSAAMNGSINVALPDGWFPEFARNGENAFIIPSCNSGLPDHVQDDLDSASLYDMLEKTVLPMYYDEPEKWKQVMISAMKDIIPAFDSKRMAAEYYDKLYSL